MPADFSGTLETLAFLFGAALPSALIAGGVAFVPWPQWRPSHVGIVLRRHGWILGLMVGTLFYDILVAQLDPYTTKWVGHDFTSFFSNIEGDFHERLQFALGADWIRVPFAIIYVIGFPFIVYFTIILFVWTNRPRHALRALAGYGVILAIALPFYLFFPVQEVWYVGKAQNWAPFTEWIRQHLYAFNEVNNAFPSLHTAISLVMAYVALRSDHRRYGQFAAALATGIVFSTFYLGIHWVLDVVGGVLLAALVVPILDRFVPVQPRKARAPSPAAAPTPEPAAATTTRVDSIENR